MFCDEPSVKVSVLMGVHNIAGLRLFDRAVGSVLAQTMDDFEFLICDDGSTDRTWELLERIAKQDARVRLLRNTRNEGLAFTLNRCLQAAQGEYVARQDADDISAPERFAVQLAFLEQHPEIAFLGSDVILWDECGAWGKREFPEYPQVRDFLFTMPFVHGALMFRREAVRKAGGYRVARETRRAEDYDLLMRMYAQGQDGANISRPLYAFREDSAARKRRKYRYRIDEAVVRWRGFRSLGLLPGAFPYVVKPLLVGLLPQQILQRAKKGRKF